MEHAAPHPVDAVITWVDGTDPWHTRRRTAAARRIGRPLHANGINPHRWGGSDELNWCLRSLANHAPWIRRIWIVTDAQQPDLAMVPRQLHERISIVDHTVIFAGFTQHLPTFNSLAIETMLWRIPDLAERFLYFNDDVFLTGTLRPDDVFRAEKPVLRGRWVDFEALADDPDKMRDPAFFNHFSQVNAARLAGFMPGHMWASAHVVHPLRRSVLQGLFGRMRNDFVANLMHPFRDLSQFQPMSLHNHVCIRDGLQVTATRRDYLHLRVGAVIDDPVEVVRAQLRNLTQPGVKFLCINDLPELEAALPDTRELIERAIGP